MNISRNDPDIAGALNATCDPEAAWFALERWLEAGGAQAAPDWRAPEFLRHLCRLFAATPALASYFIRFPERTGAVLQPVLHRGGTGRAWQWMIEERFKQTAPQGHAAQLAVLRRMRWEYMLQIAAQDLSGAWHIPSVVKALSDLADACVSAALRFAIERLRPRYGNPPKPSKDGLNFAPGAMETSLAHSWEGGQGETDSLPFTVFALGKLGGRELNYSSDIDLIFVHNGEGETSGGERSIAADEYFKFLGMELVSALDKQTEDGRVYRVDMRLRPRGREGPLAPDARSFFEYYQTEGRTWERQAWIKARAIAGDMTLGNALTQMMQPFVYRRYLTLDAIADIKSLKRLIEMGVAKAGHEESEVKLGRGGIRDIEFTVQYLQLHHGGEYPEIRGGNTLQVLNALHKDKLIAESEFRPLPEAYVFLRQVEHRLQLQGDLQVHNLPSDRLERRKIALSMGYTDGVFQPGDIAKRTLARESGSLPAIGATAGTVLLHAASAEEKFEAHRLYHTARTRDVFTKLFSSQFDGQQGPDSKLAEQLLAPAPDMRVLHAVLRTYGFLRPGDSAAELLNFTRESLLVSSPARTRKSFATLAPKLLAALKATGEPDEALSRFSRIVGSLGAKAAIYQLLHDNPWTLQMTAELAAWSEYLTGILTANPGLFDELVESLRTGHCKSLEEMERELLTITTGGDVSDTLRAYRAGELLRIGVSDLIHQAKQDEVQNELTALAEAILAAQLRASTIEHRKKRGMPPPGVGGAEIGFAIIALGKFGGREMTYGSDLDVVYFYDEGRAQDALSPAPAKTPSARNMRISDLPPVTYFSELVQTMTRAMSTPTSIGSLYDMDARLRPNGNKGPLAVSLNDFVRYWKEGQMAGWEKLAYTRARFVAGDAHVGERAMHLIYSAAYEPVKDRMLAEVRRKKLAAEVASMRLKLEENAEPDDLKRGRGGIMDIEFIVQYLQLIHGPAYPPLRKANTESALANLAKFKIITQEQSDTLLKAHAFLRFLVNRVRVVHGLSQHNLPKRDDALHKLALRADYIPGDDGVPIEKRLKDDCKRTTDTVRALFNQIIGT